MIQPPRRSVTRFFVPLIDVLILLFCIFLLMPFVSAPDADGAEERDPAVPTDVQTLRDELANAKRLLDDMRKQRLNPADRLSVKVLEIDRTDGRLYETTADGRTELKQEADARRLVNRLKFAAGGKDVFVLILYPRELTGFPLRSQVEAYRGWFRDVAVSFDNPYAR